MPKPTIRRYPQPAKPRKRERIGGTGRKAFPPPQADDVPDCLMEQNPYAPSGEAGPNASIVSRKNRGASIFWFLPTATAGNFIAVALIPGNQLSDWTVRTLIGISITLAAMAGVVAVVSLLAYGLLGLIFKLRSLATRGSRMATGIASSVGIGLSMYFYLLISVRGTSMAHWVSSRCHPPRSLL